MTGRVILTSHHLEELEETLRILYGVVGEGMGHATRSGVVLSHLVAGGHEIRVVVSGRAHVFLEERFRKEKTLTVEEIDGLTLRYFGNRLDRAGSLFWNLRSAPKAVRKNIKVYRKVAEDGFRPELVISDFESFAALYALRHGVPVVSIDNIRLDSTPCAGSHFEGDVNLVCQLQFDWSRFVVVRDNVSGELAASISLKRPFF